MYVKCDCNGENCKVNIARVILSFMLEVCLFVDRLYGQHIRLTTA